MAINGFRGKYRFLSNFYSNFGKSAEHYYQAEKAVNKDDAQWIRNARTPGEAKRRGRKVKMRTDWDEVKLEVMRRIVRTKFEDKGLARLLLATDSVELIEGNYWGDVFWGVCRGVGENHLGKILMQVREELRENGS